MKKITLTLALLASLISCDPFHFDDMPKSSEKELKKNLDKNKIAISTLKSYYNSITLKDLEVYIEYKYDKLIDLKVYRTTEDTHVRDILFQRWDIDPFDDEEISETGLDSLGIHGNIKSLDIIKKRLGRTDKIFKDIKKHLDKADCISITNGNPSQIGFKRSGMGMYFYNLFDKPVNDSLKSIYNDSCQYRLYNDTVALEYKGGGFGSQCFPDR